MCCQHDASTGIGLLGRLLLAADVSHNTRTIRPPHTSHGSAMCVCVSLGECQYRPTSLSGSLQRGLGWTAGGPWCLVSCADCRFARRAACIWTFSETTLLMPGSRWCAQIGLRGLTGNSETWAWALLSLPLGLGLWTALDSCAGWQSIVSMSGGISMWHPGLPLLRGQSFAHIIIGMAGLVICALSPTMTCRWASVSSGLWCSSDLGSHTLAH